MPATVIAPSGRPPACPNWQLVLTSYNGLIATMVGVTCTKGFTNSFSENLHHRRTSPPARGADEEARPMNAPRKPDGAAGGGWPRAARHQGEQGQERRCRAAALKWSPSRSAATNGPGRDCGRVGRAAARLLPDHRRPPRASPRLATDAAQKGWWEEYADTLSRITSSSSAWSTRPLGWPSGTSTM